MISRRFYADPVLRASQEKLGIIKMKYQISLNTDTKSCVGYTHAYNEEREVNSV